MSTLIRDVRQAAIRDAARELFSRQGYHKTTMPEIARAAGTSVGLIYYHFTSKAEILVAIVEEFYAFGLAALADPQVGTTHRERLDRVVRDLFVAYDRFSQVFVILYKDLAFVSREERHRIYALEEETIQHVQAVIQAGQAAGEFADDLPNIPLLAADIVGMGPLWVLKKTWYFASRLTIDEYIETQLDYIHRLLAQPAGDGSVPHHTQKRGKEVG